jgi:Stress responsive A/B Barrel Domain
MIQHTVVFKLKHEQGSVQERAFLDATAVLARIEGVEDFQVLRQVGTKNDYSFGLSMLFKNQDTYQYYNDHPDHVQFVESIWIPQVESFMEIDYERLR